MTSSARLVVLSGPSGVGKTTVCQLLLERSPHFGRAITATTRPPREGEVNGRDYHFLSMDEFQQGLKTNRFLEHAEVFGKLYGTPRESVESVLNSGRSVLLNIDVQGAATLREAPEFPMISVFLLPPSMDLLEQRLRSRETDSAEVIERRLKEARREVEAAPLFDHQVVNDDLETTLTTIMNLLAQPSHS